MTSQGITIHTSTRIPVGEPAISWGAIPEATEAHAFKASGPGWMRSICRATPYNFRTQPVADDFPRCAGCAVLIDGAPGEVTQVFGS